MTDSNIYEQVNSKLGFTRPETDHSHAMHLVSTSPASLAADHQHLDLGGEHIVLQSLKDLYLEQGDVREAATSALCMTLEYALAKEDHQSGHKLLDSEAIEILERLSMKPEPELQGLGAILQGWLRLELSLQDYSRAELRQALRRCLRSAQREHKKGPREYLGLIHHHIH